ncbi:MAG TPA: peptidyl-prolyl cis-trans isomerase [Desulfuromonadales bacterium]|nr:peptidyl-prolyl cis-trans isomerase [Desulfuromonadales bacterium]
MKRFVLLVGLLVGLMPALSARAEVVDRIAAIVNNEIITTVQLNQEIESRLQAQGKTEKDLLPGDLSSLRKQALSQLIDETLIKERADADGIQITGKDVDAAIQDVERQNHMTRDQLIAALKAQGMDFDAYRENMRRQILRFKLMGREVRSKIEITDEDILKYYRDHIDQYRKPATLDLARISFTLPDQATAPQIAAVKAKAEAALAKLRKGEDFYQVLLTASADKSATGGDLGSFSEGDLTPVFAKAVASLKAGDVSSVIETPQGYTILKVMSRQPGSSRQMDAVKDEIRHTLRQQKMEEGIKAWAKELRKGAHIKIML